MFNRHRMLTRVTLHLVALTPFAEKSAVRHHVLVKQILSEIHRTADRNALLILNVQMKWLV